MKPRDLSKLSADDLRKAAEIKGQMERLQRELSETLDMKKSSRKSRAQRFGNRIWFRKARMRATKGKMSAAGRARIAAAARARWKKAKAAGRNRL